MKTRLLLVLAVLGYALGIVIATGRITAIGDGRSHWDVRFVLVVAALVAVPLLVLAVLIVRTKHSAFRTRQGAAVRQLTPDAVLFGAWESPQVAAQVSALSGQPVKRQKNPLAVSLTRTELAVWRGDERPERVLSLPTSTVRAVASFDVTLPNTRRPSQTAVLFDISWQGQPVGLALPIFEGQFYGSTEQQARVVELVTALRLQLPSAP